MLARNTLDSLSVLSLIRATIFVTPRKWCSSYFRKYISVITETTLLTILSAVFFALYAHKANIKNVFFVFGFAEVVNSAALLHVSF